MTEPNRNHLEPVDLRADGLLWYLNRVALHPRGFAPAFNPNTGDLFMMGDGTEPWRFELGGAVEDDLFRAFNAMLNRTADATRGEVSDT